MLFRSSRRRSVPNASLCTAMDLRLARRVLLLRSFFIVAAK